jgi:hypothetical protein
VATAASYPTDVKTLHFMLDEQRQLIESLKANLHRLLKWQFGPKSEHLNVDQLGLFVDDSVVIEVPASAPADHAERSNTGPATSERRRAVRVLRNLPRVIEEIDLPEAQKSAPAAVRRLPRSVKRPPSSCTTSRPGSKSTRHGAASIPAATATGPWSAPRSSVAADPEEHGLGEPAGVFDRQSSLLTVCRCTGWRGDFGASASSCPTP